MTMCRVLLLALLSLLLVQHGRADSDCSNSATICPGLGCSAGAKPSSMSQTNYDYCVAHIPSSAVYSIQDYVDELLDDHGYEMMSQWVKQSGSGGRRELTTCVELIASGKYTQMQLILFGCLGRRLLEDEGDEEQEQGQHPEDDRELSSASQCSSSSTTISSLQSQFASYAKWQIGYTMGKVTSYQCNLLTWTCDATLFVC